MVTKGTPSDRYRFRPSKKQLKQSYEVRLAAQFGNREAKKKLLNYNRKVRERKKAVSSERWVVDGREFTRYRMMDFIVNQVAEGFSLPDLCDVEGMPSMREVYAWFDNHPEFARDYQRAEEIRGHRLGEEALRVGMNTDRENVAADKLKVEVLAKAAARTNVRFADKQTLRVEDEFSQMSVDQIKARIAAMVAANPDLVQAIPNKSLQEIGLSHSREDSIMDVPVEREPTSDHD